MAQQVEALVRSHFGQQGVGIEEVLSIFQGINIQLFPLGKRHQRLRQTKNWINRR